MEPKLFNFYKKGNAMGVLISPLCVPVLDSEGKPTGKMECEPHTTKPEELAKMMADIQGVLAKHGFEVHIFGPPDSMLKSLAKKTPRQYLSRTEALDFGRECYHNETGDIPSSKHVDKFILSLEDNSESEKK